MRPLILLALAVIAVSSQAQVRRSLRLQPGEPAEAAALVPPTQGVVLRDASRVAQAGGTWAYRLPALPGASVRLTCRAQGDLSVSISGPDGKALTARRTPAEGGFAVETTVPQTHAPRSPLTFRFRAGSEAVLLGAVYTMTAADANRNGIPDALDALLAPAKLPVPQPQSGKLHTSFQTGGPYRPEHAVTTDVALVFSSNREVLQSWAEAGYTVYCIGGFRDYEDYVREHPGEVQRDREGRPLVIGGNSYYMVPTEARNRRWAQYYLEAIANSARGVCPEEPELFARSGYSEAFQAEWQAAYGTPWVPPHTDVGARYRSETLKARLTVRQINSILSAVAERDPSVRRLLAVHSPITYSHWGIVMPHHALFQLPAVQEVIAQVWTGTARTPNRVAGMRAERTFALAYLEYASLVSLLRGLGKPVWFLMDPVEDNPDRPMEDYRRNYAETLAAALMFPGVDRFEVMPWPSRIYGRVPPDYATVINTVVGALNDCVRFPSQVRAGSRGIGMLIADSMSFQRGDPSPSDFDGVYGLSMPLVLQGVPLDVLSLDRCVEPGYLTGTRVLLGSYDFLKPSSPACNDGLAEWVRRGGVLVLFGGTDAYDAVPDSWWRAAGFVSPLDHLFQRLGVEARRVAAGGVLDVPKGPAGEILRGDGTVRNLANRRKYLLDLTPAVGPTGSVCVRFEDVSPEDGWGPYVASLELQVNGSPMASFMPGTELEARFLWVDRGSGVQGNARFADGQSFWEYRFDNLPRGAQVTLIADMGNGFLVSAYGPQDGPDALVGEAEMASPLLGRLRLLPGYGLTVCEPPSDARVLYRRASDGAPALWMARVGEGAVFYCGMPPGYLTATPLTDRWIRDIVSRACAQAGMELQTARSFRATRGPYQAVRTLAGVEKLSGAFVDLLSTDLSVVRDPEIPAGQVAFLKSLSARPEPSLVAASGRVETLSEDPLATAWVARAPEGTQGAARLTRGRRTFVGVKAWDMWGAPVAASARVDGETVLVRYPNRAGGVAVKVVWK